MKNRESLLIKSKKSGWTKQVTRITPFTQSLFIFSLLLQLTQNTKVMLNTLLKYTKTRLITKGFVKHKSLTANY